MGTAACAEGQHFQALLVRTGSAYASPTHLKLTGPNIAHRAALGLGIRTARRSPGRGRGPHARSHTAAARDGRTDGRTAAEAGTDPPGGGTAPAPRQALTARLVSIPLLCPQPSQGQEAPPPLALSPQPGIARFTPTPARGACPCLPLGQLLTCIPGSPACTGE